MPWFSSEIIQCVRIMVVVFDWIYIRLHSLVFCVLQFFVIFYSVNIELIFSCTFIIKCSYMYLSLVHWYIIYNEFSLYSSVCLSETTYHLFFLAYSKKSHNNRTRIYDQIFHIGFKTYFDRWSHIFRERFHLNLRS